MGSGEGGVSGVAGGLATNIRSRVAHVGAHWRVIARIGIAPALAWWVSTAIFGHSQAFFAPIAAILTLTIGVGWRATVVVEIIVGASVGVLVGELLVHLIGRGVWQMVFVVGVAAVVAHFARISGVALTQAVISGVLLVAIVPAPGVVDPAVTRFVDAFIGGSAALAMIIAIPTNPVRDLNRLLDQVLGELAGILEEIGGAMRAFDAAQAGQALQRARDTQPLMEALGGTAGSVSEVARISPLRWRQRPQVEALVKALDDVEHATRNTRVLARRVAAMIRKDEPIPHALIASIDDLAHLIRTDPHNEHGLITIAEVAVRAAGQELTINTAAIASQTRAVVADLLLATGVGHTDLDDLLDFE